MSESARLFYLERLMAVQHRDPFIESLDLFNEN
jgi:hypothetical protein